MDGDIIPKQLQEEEFRFVKLLKRNKIPFEANWTQKNYRYDDESLIEWIKQGNNYGIIGGFGNLIIVDFDNEEIQNKFSNLLPKTFTVMTGSGKLHKYFICDNPKSLKILDEKKNTLIDIQGEGKQAVAPSSIHPNGNIYVVVEDNPIANLSFKQIQFIFADYLKEQQSFEHSFDIIIQEIRKRVSLVDLMNKYGYDTSRNPTMCKMGHDSNAGKCFSWNDAKGLWYCFHCLSPSQKIWTLNGFKFAKNITKEDILTNALGERVKVKFIKHHQSKENILKIYTYTTNVPLLVSKNHGMFIVKDTSCDVREHKISCTQDCNYLKRRKCARHKCNNYKISKKIFAKDLSVGDSLFFPIPIIEKNTYYIPLIKTNTKKGTHQKIFNLKLTNELLWVMGMYIAEGSVHNNYRHIQFSLHRKENEYAIRIKKYFESLHLHVNIINWKNSLTKTIHISNRWLALTFDNLLGHGCANKKIPRILLDLPKKRLKHLIKGVFDGDGFSSRDIAQTSEELAYNLFEAGLKLRNNPSVYICKKIKGKKQIFRNRFCINNTGKQIINNLYLSQIRKIEEIKNNEPYMVDIGVEGKHKSFLTLQGEVGNCDNGGDIVSFIMKHDNCDFKKAKQKLMGIAGIKESLHQAVNVFKIDYVQFAENFWELQPFFYDRARNWWLWDFVDCCWKIIDKAELFKQIYEASREENIEILKSEIKSQITTAFEIVGRGHIPKDILKTWVQFKDKVYNLKTGEIFSSTPEYFNTNPIPFDVGLSQETPTIDKIFTEWVGEQKQTLYEIFAYSILQDYPLHRIFCLVGSGNNGKSCFLRMLKKFIGNSNCISTELDSLLERFGSSGLYKKLVCMMGETNFNILSKTSLLKRLCGGDLIDFEFKGKDRFSGENYAKLIIATNTLPTTTDRTDGFYRRWMISHFPNKFLEKKDILMDIPEEEYPNLALKCLNILKRLIEQREFTHEGTVEERKERFERFSNPLNQFIKEKCVVDINSEVPIFEFCESFWIYSNERGYRRLSKWEISQQMNMDGFESKTINKKIGDEWKNWKYFIGLDFRNSRNSRNPYLYRSSYIREAIQTSVTAVTAVTKPKNNPLLWDEKSIKYVCCVYPIGDTTCSDMPCNEFEGAYYCKKHFEKVQGSDDTIQEENISQK